MDSELVFDEDQDTDNYRHVEVGTDETPTELGPRVRLYVESADGFMPLYLTQDEAYALMAALGQAARAL